MEEEKIGLTAIIKEKRKFFLNEFLNDLKSRKTIWKKEWNTELLNTKFKGKNRYKLGLVSAKRGYDDKRWYKFSEINDMNKKNVKWRDRIKIAKGEKSTEIDYWKFEKKNELKERITQEYKKKLYGLSSDEYELTDKDNKIIEHKVEEILNGRKSFFQFAAYNYFNACQIENLVKRKIKKFSQAPVIEKRIKDINTIDEEAMKLGSEDFVKDFFKKVSDKEVQELFGNENGEAVNNLISDFACLFCASELGIGSFEPQKISDKNLEMIARRLEGDPSRLDKIIEKGNIISDIMISDYRNQAKELSIEKIMESPGSSQKDISHEAEKTEIPNRLETKAENFDLKKEVQTPEEFCSEVDLFLKKEEMFFDAEAWFDINHRFLSKNIVTEIKINDNDLKLSEKETEFIAKEGIEAYIDETFNVLVAEYTPQIIQKVQENVEKALKKTPVFNDIWKGESDYVSHKIKEFIVENAKIDFRPAVENAFKNADKKALKNKAEKIEQKGPRL